MKYIDINEFCSFLLRLDSDEESVERMWMRCLCMVVGVFFIDEGYVWLVIFFFWRKINWSRFYEMFLMEVLCC